MHNNLITENIGHGEGERGWATKRVGLTNSQTYNMLKMNFCGNICTLKRFLHIVQQTANSHSYALILVVDVVWAGVCLCVGCTAFVCVCGHTDMHLYFSFVENNKHC